MLTVAPGHAATDALRWRRRSQFAPRPSSGARHVPFRRPPLPAGRARRRPAPAPRRRRAAGVRQWAGPALRRTRARLPGDRHPLPGRRVERGRLPGRLAMVRRAAARRPARLGLRAEPELRLDGQRAAGAPVRAGHRDSADRLRSRRLLGPALPPPAVVRRQPLAGAAASAGARATAAPRRLAGPLSAPLGTRGHATATLGRDPRWDAPPPRHDMGEAPRPQREITLPPRFERDPVRPGTPYPQAAPRPDSTSPDGGRPFPPRAAPGDGPRPQFDAPRPAAQPAPGAPFGAWGPSAAPRPDRVEPPRPPRDSGPSPAPRPIGEPNRGPGGRPADGPRPGGQ